MGLDVKKLLTEMDEMVELKGDDLIVFSYSHCPVCGNDIIFPDKDNPETTCERCGTTFFAEFDEQGFLLRAYRL